MTVEKIREVLHAAPFQPFIIHTADGRSLSVPHPDFVAIMNDDETIIVISPRNQKPSFTLVDVPLISALEVNGARKTEA